MTIRTDSPNPTFVTRMRRGAGVGASFGVAFAAIGLLRIIVVLLSGGHVAAAGIRDLGLLAFYVAGFALAGAVVGPLWPLRRTWPGAFLVGYVGAAIVSAVCGVIVMETNDQPEWMLYPIVVGIMTLVFGTLAAIKFRREQ